MSDSERFNVLQALELRHDELLASLTELDLRVEAALAQLRPAPPAISSAPVAVDAAKPPNSRTKKLAA